MNYYIILTMLFFTFQMRSKTNKWGTSTLKHFICQLINCLQKELLLHVEKESSIDKSRRMEYSPVYGTLSSGDLFWNGILLSTFKKLISVELMIVILVIVSLT